MATNTEKPASLPCASLSADDTQFRCTVCGQVGTVGRCCGLDTREPLNDLARAEIAAEKQRKATLASTGRVARLEVDCAARD